MLALVVNFQIVHVCAVGVNLSSNRVPGPMNEVIAEARLLDVISRRPVHFPSTHYAPTSNAFLHRLHASVACIANHGEDFAHLIGRSLADEASPGDVVIDGPGCVFLCPNIQQNEITLANGSRVFRARLVMRDRRCAR